MTNFILTLAAGSASGIIFFLLKIPNGLRIGSLLGATLFNVFFHRAWVPVETKFVVQVVAGALTGYIMKKSELARLPKVIKPTAIMLGTFLILNLGVGALIHATSPLDWMTSLFCVIPGGVTDVPVVAAAMGADTPKVALAQLARFVMGVGFFPSMILLYDTHKQKTEAAKTVKDPPAVPSAAAKIPQITAAVHTDSGKRKKSPLVVSLATLITAAAAGFLGSLTKIPAGIFLFSMAAVAVLKLKFDFAYISPLTRRIVQVISGCYIGTLITMEDILNIRLVVLPVLMMIGGYVINCFVSGSIIAKTCGLTRKESMLATTPAGASDIALSAGEIGVENTDIMLLHVIRTTIAMALFPLIINAFVTAVSR